MTSKLAMMGSNYLGSKLYKTWPIFNYLTCTICGKEFRRQWMWKFLKRRKYALERQEYRYVCHGCTSSNYNSAVAALDNHYRELTFRIWRASPPTGGSGVKSPR